MKLRGYIIDRAFGFIAFLDEDRKEYGIYS